MLQAPEPTAYDLRFQLLGIPVRVHPSFWLVMALLGGLLNVGVGNADVRPVLIFTAVGFVSILVHEFGHALAFRATGQSPRVVLYYFGGLAIGSAEERRPGRRLGIVLAGPGAGLLLLLITLLVLMAAFGTKVGDIVDLLKFYLSVPGGDPGALRLVRSRNEALLFVFNDLIEVNLLWSLLNLLPVFPLDGGQATGVILTWRDRRRGAFQLHVVSLVTAGAMVVFCLSRGNGLLFTALLFGMLGLQNFQMLQAMRHLRSPSFGEDADDWWRR